MINSDEVSNTENAITEFLVSSHVAVIAQWLAKRLQGRDAKLRRDRKADEDPEAFIVSFLYRRGSADPACEKLARAILQLLKVHPGTDVALDPVMFGVMRICQQVYLPRTAEWFWKQLKTLATRPRGPLSPIDEMTARAAVVQAHASLDQRTRPLWLKLLSSGCPTIALLGLTRGWAQQLPLLQTWWNSESVAVREKELRSLLVVGTLELSSSDVISQCREYTSQWSQPLRDAVDRGMASIGLARPFRPSAQCAIRNAIDGAARRREIVLEEEPV